MRALTRLSNLHKPEYLLLLEEEKERDETMGKKWNLSTIIGDGTSSSSARKGNSKPISGGYTNEREDEGDL